MSEPKLIHFVCINPTCKHSVYNDAEMLFSYFPPCNRDCPYCNGNLFVSPKTGISHSGNRANHLFSDVMNINSTEELPEPKYRTSRKSDKRRGEK